VLAIEGEGINKDWGALRCGAKHGGHGGHGEELIKSVQIREIGGICGLGMGTAGGLGVRCAR